MTNTNTGNRNTGNWNTGDRNTGDGNTGDWNTGNRNTGDGNTGNWNTGDRNTGSFNTTAPDFVNFFNKPLSVDVWDKCAKPDWIYRPSTTTWVDECSMTPAEKVENPTFHTCGGYLRTNDMADEWRKAYESATSEDIELTRNLPNFDAEVFKEITGIDLSGPDTPSEYMTITIDGKKYKLTEIE